MKTSNVATYVKLLKRQRYHRDNKYVASESAVHVDDGSFINTVTMDRTEDTAGRNYVDNSSASQHYFMPRFMRDHPRCLSCIINDEVRCGEQLQAMIDVAHLSSEQDRPFPT